MTGNWNSDEWAVYHVATGRGATLCGYRSDETCYYS